MKRLNANIRSLESAFEQAPEVLQSIRVNAAFGVALCMVNDLVQILVTEFIVRFQRIGKNLRAFGDMLAHVRLKLLSVIAPDVEQPHTRRLRFCRALQNALNGFQIPLSRTVPLSPFPLLVIHPSRTTESSLSLTCASM